MADLFVSTLSPRRSSRCPAVLTMQLHVDCGAEIQRHPWFLEDLPPGVAEMNSRLVPPGASSIKSFCMPEGVQAPAFPLCFADARGL